MALIDFIGKNGDHRRADETLTGLMAEQGFKPAPRPTPADTKK